MATFLVKLTKGQKRITLNKTLDELNVLLKDAKVANLMLKVGDTLINPNIVETISEE